MAQDIWQDTDDDFWVDTTDDEWVDEIPCPTDCTNCCYELVVNLYYLGGECGEIKCSDYNGVWLLTQEGAAGTDCAWSYTAPSGVTIRVHCDAGYWWLTIANGPIVCAQWKYSLEGYP